MDEKIAQTTAKSEKASCNESEKPGQKLRHIGRGQVVPQHGLCPRAPQSLQVPKAMGGGFETCTLLALAEQSFDKLLLRLRASPPYIGMLSTFEPWGKLTVGPVKTVHGREQYPKQKNFQERVLPPPAALRIVQQSLKYCNTTSDNITA